jgi:hypothetical protein
MGDAHRIARNVPPGRHSRYGRGRRFAAIGIASRFSQQKLQSSF